MVDDLDGALLCLSGNHVWKRSVYFFEIYRTLRRERVLIYWHAHDDTILNGVFVLFKS